MSEKSLFKKILPEAATNTYTGHPIAYYFFILLTLVTIGRSLIHMLAPDGGAQSIASININVAGGETIIGIFGQWGLSQLLLGIVFLIVVVRYRNLIPLMYVITIVEYTGRIAVGLLKSIETEFMALSRGALSLLSILVLLDVAL